MMMIEKIAVGNPELPTKRLKKVRKAKRWLPDRKSPKNDIDPDGQSRKGLAGAGGGAYENVGENTGGVTFVGQGEGYRRAT
jgi:hypothetical protein